MELIIFLLSIIFVALLFIVCGKKAFRSLGSLFFTVIILIFFVTPLIVHGYDPELAVFVVGLPILICIVYLTEGFTLLSHLSIIAIVLNFLLISALIHFSVVLAHLSGLISSDASFLGLTGVNLQQLLIAGIMLGTLGILTEMVVTQVATVIEFANADQKADEKEIYKRSYAVGIAHLGSIINTLFLVYAGVSFPLIIIYAGSGSSLYNALNYEPLASEIIRMLSGTIGLIIAMPSSTALAIWWLKKRKIKNT